MEKSKNRWQEYLVISLAFLFILLKMAEAADDITLVRRMPSEVNLSQIKRVAIMPLENDPRDRITNTLGATLQKTGQFEILERSQLDQILREHNLNVTGMVDESSAAEVGQILGVEALIYGSVNSFRVYDERTQKKLNIKLRDETYTDKKGKTKTREVRGDIMAPAVIRRGELDLTIKVVDVQSALIVAQKNDLQTFEETKIIHAQADQVDLPSNGEIERRMIDAALSGFSRYVAPYQQVEEIRWDGNCDMDECKEALDYIELNLLDEALKPLEKLLDKAMANTKKRKKEKGKDRNLAAVYYSMALVYELKGDMEMALDLYTQSLKARIKEPAEKQKEARERVEQYIQAWLQYEDQISTN